MNRKRKQIPVFGLLVLTSLAGCSSDGDTSIAPPAPSQATSAEGIWTGTTSTGRTVTGVVLDNGVYWFLYSVVGNPSIIAGVVQGESSSQNGTFTSSNVTDFSIERATPILNPTVDGSYMMKQSLNGTISYQATQDTFATTYNSEYELTPDLNTIAGNYTGPVALNETVDVTVSAAGNIIGQSSATPQCTFNGLFKPRARGNVFDVTITFGPQDTCSNKNATVTGVGFVYAGKLYSAALNDAKTNGVVFIGTKQ
ncbi:MAG: hypothetical protein KF876_04355 [Nitrospira sp.]|nr:hypothetical protein [Nitrospira sp.]